MLCPAPSPAPYRRANTGARLGREGTACRAPTRSAVCEPRLRRVRLEQAVQRANTASPTRRASECAQVRARPLPCRGTTCCALRRLRRHIGGRSRVRAWGARARHAVPLPGARYGNRAYGGSGWSLAVRRANLGPVCGACVRPPLSQTPCVHAEKTVQCTCTRWSSWTNRDRT